MINVSGLKKSFGQQDLFSDVSFVINPQERVGLVGRNGHGKSTLFKIILGNEEADSGEVFIPKGYTMGHLSQHLVFSEPSILDEVCLALPLLDGCWKETYKAEAMLHGLGFTDEDFLRAPSEFSGGYQIRLNLAKLLLSEPKLLLLDEPTNYLDIVSVRWLVRFLNEWENELLLITHDRSFMDAVSTHTMGIHRGRIKKVQGGTEKFYTTLAEEEELYEKTRLGEEKKRKEIENFVNKFRAKASKAKSVQSRVKLLEKMEVKEELGNIESLEFSFSNAPFPGKWLMTVEDLSFGYDPDDLLFENLTFSVKKEDRIGIIGPNGKGKTTLLNTLASEIKALTGEVSLNDNTKLAYFGQTNINRLNTNNTVEDEIGEVDRLKSRTIIRSICGAMMFEGDSALKKISVLSGGERSRVLLGKILVTPSNLLFLDEPTNHLDMYSIDSLCEAIDEFQGGVLIVTHSEDLLERICNRLIIFDAGEVELFEGGYKEFLEERGWNDEKDEKSKKKPKKHSLKDRNDSTKKSNNQLLKIERQIEEAESTRKMLEADLHLATQSKDVDKIRQISDQLKNIISEIDSLYSLL